MSNSKTHRTNYGILIVGMALYIVVGALTTLYGIAHSENSPIFIYTLMLFPCVFIAIFPSRRLASTRALQVAIYLISFSVASGWGLMIANYFQSFGGEAFTPALFGSNPDDRKYYDIGLSIAKHWSATGDLFSLDGYTEQELKRFKYSGFPYVVAIILYLCSLVGDYSTFAFRLTGALGAALVSLYTFRLARTFFSERIARRAAFMTVIIPIFAYYAAIGTRDPLIAAMIIMVVFHFVSAVLKAKQSVSRALPELLPIITFLLFLYQLRSASVLALLFALALWLAYEWSKTRQKLSLAAILAIFVLLVTTGKVLFPEATVEDSFEQADRYSTAITETANEDSLSNALIFSLPAAIRYPLSIIYTVFIPVPPIKSFHTHHLILGIGAAIWYFLVPFWLYGMYVIRKIPSAAVLTVTCITLLLAVAYVVPSIRHKTQFLAFAIIHASCAQEVLGKRSALLGVATLITILALGFVYALLKTL